MNKADYPAHWQELRRLVLKRADERCECFGECGANHAQAEDPSGFCRAPHRALIARDPKYPARWWLSAEVPWAYAYYEPLPRIKVILTIAHLCQDSLCDDIYHLKAFCQRCHLVYDQAQHKKNAHATWKRKQQGAQLDLLLDRQESEP